MRKKLGIPIWALVLIVIGCLGIGGAAGAGSPEEEKDDGSVTAVIAQAQRERDDAVNTARRTIEAEYSARKVELDSQAAALAERERKVATAEVAKKKSEFGDGVYQVGTDIVPGTYKTDGSAGCYWEKTARDGDIIDNDNLNGPGVVVIEASVFSFKTQRCGTWRKTG